MKIKVPNGIDNEGRQVFNEVEIEAGKTVELNQEATKKFVTVEKKVFNNLMIQLKIAYKALRFLSIKSEFARNTLDELEMSKIHTGKDSFEGD